MKTLAVNSSNDIYAVNGVLALAEGANSVIQRAAQVMKLALGEAIYDVDKGIPYFQVVFTGSPNLLAFEAASRASLLSVSGVVSVQSFDANIRDNNLSYSATLLTEQGLINLSDSTLYFRQVS